MKPELHGGRVPHENHDETLRDVGWSSVRDLHEAYMEARADVKRLCQAMMDVQAESYSVAEVRRLGVEVWNSWAM